MQERWGSQTDLPLCWHLKVMADMLKTQRGKELENGNLTEWAIIEEGYDSTGELARKRRRKTKVKNNMKSWESDYLSLKTLIQGHKGKIPCKIQQI